MFSIFLLCDRRYHSYVERRTITIAFVRSNYFMLNHAWYIYSLYIHMHTTRSYILVRISPITRHIIVGRIGMGGCPVDTSIRVWWKKKKNFFLGPRKGVILILLFCWILQVYHHHTYAVLPRAFGSAGWHADNKTKKKTRKASRKTT
jgi:hypothetical protein